MFKVFAAPVYIEVYIFAVVATSDLTDAMVIFHIFNRYKHELQKEDKDNLNKLLQNQTHYLVIALPYLQGLVKFQACLFYRDLLFV